MTGPFGTHGEQALRIEPLGDGNRAEVMELASRAWDRSRSSVTAAWRYEQCPALAGAVARHGQSCVASVFAMRRTYWAPTGDFDCLEPFDWYTTEEWRPKGAGLRVMKHLMADTLPLIAMGGSEGGQQLLRRLGWKHAWTATGLTLPLTGRYLRSRGRGHVVARGFDLVGRGLYRVRRPSGGALRAEPAAMPGPGLDGIIRRQRRFAVVPRPDPALLRWLRNAPPEMGLYLGFNLLRRDEMIGWAWARVVTVKGLRLGHLHDLLLTDDARDLYPVAVRTVVSSLVAFGLDAVLAATTCPDTLAALQGARFRPNDTIPLFVWGEVPPGPALITYGHAENAFFPAPTARDAAWLET